jgi:hypothetical protein
MSPHDPFNVYFLHHTAAARFSAEHHAEGTDCLMIGATLKMPLPSGTGR